MNYVLLVIGLLMLSGSNLVHAVHSDTLVVRLNDDTPRTIEVRGVSGVLLVQVANKRLSRAEWHDVFPVFVGSSQAVDPTSLPMAGAYTIEESIIRFIPLYPLMPGQTYYALFDSAALHNIVNAGESLAESKPVSTEFEVPRPVSMPTRVTQVYPTSDLLPENLLRFYIYFSNPMREGDFLSYIHLYDEQNNDLKGVFFDNLYELWDPSHQRLTIILDPGRVKTGLVAHENMGRALARGEEFRLVIDRTWLDANGHQLADDFIKTFRVMPEDVDPPDHVDWTIGLPEAGSMEPLMVSFAEPLDHALLSVFLQVVSSDGSDVRGTIELENMETQWLFYPEDAWPAGQYALLIDPRLEDLAANSLKGRFDKPANERLRYTEHGRAKLTFEIQ